MIIDTDQFVGVPFVNRGRGPEGYDCWGLVMRVFEEYGIELPDYRISCFATRRIGIQVEVARGDWVRLNKPEAPCIVTMRIDPAAPKLVNHIGAYVGGNRFLHTMKDTHSILSRIDDVYFKGMIEGFYRYDPR